MKIFSFIFSFFYSSLRKASVGKLIYFQSGKIILLRGCFESIESHCSLFLSVQPGLVLSQLAFEECFGQSARFATWDYTNSRDLDLTCEYSMQSFFCKFRFLKFWTTIQYYSTDFVPQIQSPLFWKGKPWYLPGIISCAILDCRLLLISPWKDESFTWWSKSTEYCTTGRFPLVFKFSTFVPWLH